MVHGARSGHPGGSLGCTEFFVTLFFELMNRKPGFSMEGKGEDVFFLSNGHISPVFYSTLARCGYFELEELRTFRKINSRLQGHPATHEGLPGIRVASGSLGQGLSVACGMALAKKHDRDRGLVYLLMSDGEHQEGQIWEGVLFAAHKKIDNLIATVDFNGIQIDGKVEGIVSLGNLAEKYRCFGWEVFECDGNDIGKLTETFARAKSRVGGGKPIIVVMKTRLGKGVKFMEDKHEWHGVAPDDQQLADALSQIEETLGDF